MKAAILLISLALTLASALLTDQEEWANFKTLHKKIYQSAEAEAQRFEVFKNNLEMIRKHNLEFEQGKTSWKMGVNQFSDLTEEEFKNNVKGILPPKNNKQ
ncbi:cathepsin L-like proteinase [Dendroctonus ponderosae]